MTKLCGICVLGLLFGFVSVGYAADANANNAAKQPLLPLVELNGVLQGYSVELDTDRPSQSDVTTPQGLLPLQDHDEIKPFLGLKLTKPLGSK